jgi:hypothetical protein
LARRRFTLLMLKVAIFMLRPMRDAQANADLGRPRIDIAILLGCHRREGADEGGHLGPELFSTFHFRLSAFVQE